MKSDALRTTSSRERHACTDKAVASNVLPCQDRFKKETILGVLGYPQKRHDRCDEIHWQLDIDRYTVSSFFMENEPLDDFKRGEWGEIL